MSLPEFAYEKWCCIDLILFENKAELFVDPGRKVLPVVEGGHMRLPRVEVERVDQLVRDVQLNGVLLHWLKIICKVKTFNNHELVRGSL